MERTDTASNRCAVFRLEGAIDEARLDRAIAETIRCCPPLTYKFLKLDEGLRIMPSLDGQESMHVIEVADESDVFALIENYRLRSFRLDGGAPYLFCLLRGNTLSHLVFVCHPVLIDRFSLKPLFETISAYYNGRPVPETLALQQETLLKEEADRLGNPLYEESMRFWLQVGRDAAFEWRPPRLDENLSENYFNVELSKQQTSALKNLSDRLGIGLDDLLLFCFHIFLFRMTRSETVMTAYCHRIRSASGAVGFNENKPMLRSQIDPDMPAIRFFRDADRLFKQTKLHSDIPSREIIREFFRADPGYRWPTNVVFNEDALPYRELALEGVSVTLLPHFSHRREMEDVAVSFDIQDTITFHIFSRSPQDVPGLKTAIEHYLTLLEYIPEDIEKPISSLRLFTEHQKQKALQLADGGNLLVPAEDVLLSLAELCRSIPDAPALTFENCTLSYRELALSAGSIASHLKPKCNGLADPLVGICLGRSERMIQAIYGVLASDAGYLPLDPGMPAERLSFIAGDAQLVAVITDSATRDIIAGIVNCPVFLIDSLLDTPSLPRFPKNSAEAAHRTAYVIYTSGTTGKPKGVVIERRMLAHMVASLEGLWDRGPGSRWMQFASINFDASVMEIFNPLTRGGELVVAPTESRADPEAVFSLLSEKRVTHAFIPPAMLRLLPKRPLPDLCAVYCGGEALDEETVRFWSKTLQLDNLYGPTEATVLATDNPMGGFKMANHLGRPIRGYFTYILDANGELSPVGGIGEICIGGDGVSRGYLGRPELTAQKFMPDPFRDNGRIYRSGDLGRFLPNGDLEFLGRCDFQVKIRGFRIELGDIENAIASQPEVKGCYVGVFDRPGGKAILAWYISKGLGIDSLRERLAARLPHYMVPAFLIPLDSFPVNLSGKIDRTRLPMPENKPVEIAELDDLGIRVRNIWAASLNAPPSSIGRDSHFFHLGGHSLLAAMVCNKLNAVLGGEIRPKRLFEHPVFGDFCEQVRAAPCASGKHDPLVATGQNRAPNQNRLIGLIYSRNIRFPEDNTYNIVARIDFSKEIHPLLLRQSFRELLEANPAFRTEFCEIEGRVWIRESDRTQLVIPIIDATSEQTTRRADDMRATALGVQRSPLWEAEIHCREDGTTALLLNIHHAIFDGWSLNLMLEELGARYEAKTAELAYERQRLTWFDYCLWARTLSETASFHESIGYWKEKLANVDPHIEYPTDFHQKRSDSNEAIDVRFEPNTVTALKAFADSRNMTLPPLIFALYLVWVWRISGKSNLVCGYPYAGRDVPGSEEIYGMFVTMGVLCQELHPKQSFGDLALAVHRQMLDDKDHLQATPYDAETGGLDSLNTIFSLQSGISLEGSFGGATFKANELPSLTSKADLTGVFYQSADGGIEGSIQFDASLFKSQTIATFLEAFRNIVESAARQPDLRVCELGYQSEISRSQFLDMACGAQLDMQDQSIPARFVDVVMENADTTALIFENRKHTYRELDMWSNRIATGLARHVNVGSQVGLAMQKSDTLVASVLAILKLGCAYVPLDPSYPPDRLLFFVENAAVQTVVADAQSREALSAIGLSGLDYVDPQQVACEPEARLPNVSPDALAYIIHTSGSTGKPKGVMVEHRTVPRLARANAMMLEFGYGGVGALIASMNFDASVLELFGALLEGRTLVVIPEEARKNPAQLHQALMDHGVTHALLSPVVLQNLPKKPLPALKTLGFGGDTIDEQTADWWSRQTRFFSLYGPTETTVMASAGEILPGANSRIIGKPIAGYRLYLLNPQKQPVPLGAVGEICIGGSGLARGYLNRDDQTMERFVIDPFGGSPYALMYMTGDLGRFLPDGTIEFFGRNDAQVKVRGFRIELGEIENRLSAFPGILHVACAAKGGGDNRYLAAYYVAEKTIDEDAMRQFIGQTLPEYMVPAFFVKLVELPASPSGKIDRKKLPEVSGKACANPPRDGLERQIADIWEDILHFRGIGRDESFFRVGGNSLLAVRMQAEVQKKLGLEFSIADFYNASTIEALASRQKTDYIQMAIRDSESPLRIENPATSGPRTPPESILLTGASGFLGIFLLAELVQKTSMVYCLQRCKDENTGMEALRLQAANAGLDIDWSRVRIVCGDLSEPNLALSGELHRQLARDLDAIVHCGAFVHHLHSYQTMKAANVDSTIELLKLALDEKKKAFCFVSTLSVTAILDGVRAAPEVIVPNRPVADSGYLLTKWAAEIQVARCAAEYGLDAVIARPGNITGCSTTGFSNFDHNHFWLFNKGCLQLGAYPDMPAKLEMTPVDMLARAIVALLPEPESGLRVANLCNPQILGMRDFFEKLARCGFSIDIEAPKVWQQRLDTIDENNGLSQIKEFYTGDLSGEAQPIEQSAILTELARRGASLQTDYDVILPVYVDYLRKAGFLQ